MMFSQKIPFSSGKIPTTNSIALSSGSSYSAVSKEEIVAYSFPCSSK
jgi:hypothetical protein